MRKILSLLFITVACNYCFAQSDTTIIYVAKTGDTTRKENSVSYFKIYRNGNLWHGTEYYTKDDKIKSEADYTNVNLDTVNGILKNFTDGILSSSTSYSDGKETGRDYYYESGNKKSHISYGNKTVTDQKGWDENGKEIKGYIVEQGARFKGGSEAWIKYLQKNLNSGIAVESGAPPGDYTVVVSFVVNKEGSISEVKASDIPDKCHACAKEAVSVIMNSPNWEPAILNNVPTLYRQKQQLTFQVIEDTKKKKKE